MKSFFCFLGLLAGFVGSATAQQGPATRQLAPSFGLKAGFNLSNIVLASPSDFDFKSRASFNAGVMANLPFSDLLSFHPELLYSQKGNKLSANTEYNGLPITLTGSQRLHYLDLPLLLRLQTNGLFFEAGPQLGYLLGVKQQAEIAGPGLDPQRASNTDTNGFRRFDVGYVVGVGYQLPQGLEFGLRYNGGITNLNKYDDNKLRNSVFQAQVGYSFGK